jgi:mRNA deadenylase 3'-5' endonuclease subunit Ccr4
MEEVQGRATSKPEPDNHQQQLREILGKCGYEAASYALLADTSGTPIEGNQLGTAVYFRKDSFEECPLEGQGSNWDGYRGRINIAQEIAKLYSMDKATAKYYTFHKAQAAAWVRLRHKASGQSVVACAVHITAAFRNPDVQVLQAQTLLNYLHENILQDGDHFILCGDFNSFPSSGLYELCTTGQLEPAHPHAQPTDKRVSSPCHLGFSLDFGGGLRSAYKEVNGSEPETTNVTPEFTGTLDYIFHSSSLSPVAVLPTPSLTEARSENKGLPSAAVPSDHVPIAARFQFCV